MPFEHRISAKASPPSAAELTAERFGYALRPVPSSSRSRMKHVTDYTGSTIAFEAEEENMADICGVATERKFVCEGNLIKMKALRKCVMAERDHKKPN